VVALVAALIAPVTAQQVGATVLYKLSTITAATKAAERLLRSEYVISPTGLTFAMSPATDGLVGVRGALTVAANVTVTDGYFYGVQGKALTTAGATLTLTNKEFVGVLGSLDMPSTTINSGHIAAVIATIQNTPTSPYVNLFYGESVTGNVINSMFSAIAKSTYVFDLSSNSHTQMSSTCTPSAVTGGTGGLKVLVDGVVRWIPLAATCS
jgi:hypothetical protein